MPHLLRHRMLVSFVFSEGILTFTPVAKNCHYLFKRLRSVAAAGFVPRSFACEANAVPLSHRRGFIAR